ncbi:MAG: hypothetical protein IT429_17985 [Gemmataceae bacterium]|nr:hypothetical protein [Gemmataceae bacterium]
MIFRCRNYTVPNPVPSLGGARFRYKPILPLVLIGPTGQAKPNAILDSAADDVVFSQDLAAQLGIDLSKAPQLQALGVGSGQPSALLFAPVILELSDGTETVRWRSVVAFTPARLRLPLFGIAGGMEHFRTTVDGSTWEIVMEPLPSLPATQDSVP